MEKRASLLYQSAVVWNKILCVADYKHKRSNLSRLHTTRLQQQQHKDLYGIDTHNSENPLKLLRTKIIPDAMLPLSLSSSAVVAISHIISPYNAFYFSCGNTRARSQVARILRAIILKKPAAGAEHWKVKRGCACASARLRGAPRESTFPAATYNTHSQVLSFINPPQPGDQGQQPIEIIYFI